MTPGEFHDLVKGYNWRREQEHNLLVRHAWLVARLQRGKKLPSLSKLLNNNKPKRKKKNKQELQKEWEELQADFGL